MRVTCLRQRRRAESDVRAGGTGPTTSTCEASTWSTTAARVTPRRQRTASCWSLCDDHRRRWMPGCRPRRAHARSRLRAGRPPRLAYPAIAAETASDTPVVDWLVRQIHDRQHHPQVIHFSYDVIAPGGRSGPASGSLSPGPRCARVPPRRPDQFRLLAAIARPFRWPRGHQLAVVTGIRQQHQLGALVAQEASRSGKRSTVVTDDDPDLAEVRLRKPDNRHRRGPVVELSGQRACCCRRHQLAVAVKQRRRIVQHVAIAPRERAATYTLHCLALAEHEGARLTIDGFRGDGRGLAQSRQTLKISAKRTSALALADESRNSAPMVVIGVGSSPPQPQLTAPP